MAEAAQIILRNVSYEIPALKKQLAKIDQDQQVSILFNSLLASIFFSQDCLKRQNESQRQIKLCEEKFSLSCSQLGIAGKSAKAELLALASDISSDLGAIENEVKSLQSAFSFYSDFVTFLHKGNYNDKDLLPMLQYLLKNGNTSHFQFRTGVVPDTVLPPMALAKAQATDAACDEEGDIDWGDMGDSTVPTETVGFEVVNVDPELAVEIIVEGEQNRKQSPDETIEVSFGDDGKVAEGDDALSVLENNKTRMLLLDDLAELDSFLSQRITEINLAESGSQAYVETVAMDSAPQSILKVSLSEITNYHKIVESVTKRLQSDRLIHFFKIRSSESYLDKLSRDLERISSNGEKAKQLVELLGQRHVELGENIPKIKLEMCKIAKKTLALKEKIEGQISTKYNNRDVNLIGEIYQLSNLID